MNYVMGIDLGTSSTKAMIMDEFGKCLGIGRGTYPVDIPGEHLAEQDPEKWWIGVKDAITEVLRVSGIQPEDIGGIGFSGQMHGMVALDSKGDVLRPAIIHLDQRCAGELAEIREKAGSLMQTELLNQPSAGMLIGSLYWMKKYEKELYDRIAVVMSPKDYIRYRLCGEIGSDYSDASAALAFSTKNKEWCRELLGKLEIRDDIWPEVHGSCEIAGKITGDASAETGLSVKTAVVYGAGDSLCALTGSGVIETGTMACNIGTASQLCLVVDKPICDEKLRIQTWCHSADDRWAIQSGALNGGSTLNWLKSKALMTGKTFEEMDEEAGRIPAGSEGLMFLPYLAGERTPWNDPYARGTYHGLSLQHEQAHIVRATMEGVMYNLRECLVILDQMDLERNYLISAGGGAKGKTWRQIQADMLNMPVHTTLVSEEACQGAAMMALVGLGVYPDLAEAAKATVHMSSEVTEPIAENVKIYEDRQVLFHELYKALRDLRKYTDR